MLHELRAFSELFRVGVADCWTLGTRAPFRVKIAQISFRNCVVGPSLLLYISHSFYKMCVGLEVMKVLHNSYNSEFAADSRGSYGGELQRVEKRFGLH